MHEIVRLIFYEKKHVKVSPRRRRQQHYQCKSCWVSASYSCKCSIVLDIYYRCLILSNVRYFNSKPYQMTTLIALTLIWLFGTLFSVFKIKWSIKAESVENREHSNPVNVLSSVTTNSTSLQPDLSLTIADRRGNLNKTDHLRIDFELKKTVHKLHFIQ